MLTKIEELEIINLSQPNEQGLSLLIDSIKDAQEVNIFVHPFYMEYHLGYRNKSGMKEFRGERNDFFCSIQKDHPPVVILEPIQSYGDLSLELEAFGCNSRVFAFATPPNHPAPISPVYYLNQATMEALKKGLIKVPNREERSLCWDHLTNLINVSGINEVKVSGQCLLYLEESEMQNKLFKEYIEESTGKLLTESSGKINGLSGDDLIKIPYYCVGIMAIELASRGKNVSLSLPLWPNKVWRESPI